MENVVCKKCGAPVVEGATYCGYCGTRVDGKKECGACGKLNDENFSFCIYCGARIDGKAVCANCGTAHEGSFCPSCGQAANAHSSERRGERSRERAQGGKGGFARVCDIVGGAAMMLGVLFSVIFTFLIGLVAVSDGKTVEKVNIFTFFGEYYKDTEDFSGVGLTAWWKDLIEGQNTLYGVLGTVFAAVVMLCVVGFATVAIVKYILSWTKKTENKANGWALASILSFLIGAIWFYSYVKTSGAIEGAKELGISNSEAETKFNGATIVAIILCAVCVVTSVVFRFMGKGKEPWTGKRLGGTVCAIVGVLFAGVVLAMTQFAGFNFTMSTAGLAAEYEILEQYNVDNLLVKVLTGFGYFNVAANTVFSELITFDLGAELYNELTSELSILNAYNVIAQVGVLLLTVFAAFSVYANVRGVQGERNKGVLWAAFAVGSAVLVLVFHILSYGKFMNIIKLGETGEALEALEKMLSASFGVSICSVVFALLLLGVSIVRFVFVKKSKEVE